MIKNWNLFLLKKKIKIYLILERYNQLHERGCFTKAEYSNICPIASTPENIYGSAGAKKNHL